MKKEKERKEDEKREGNVMNEKNKEIRMCVCVCVGIYNKKQLNSLDALRIFIGFYIKTRTHVSKHVQIDNKDFVCASRSLFSICTCPLISKSLFISPPSLKTIFSNDLFDKSR
jgi:hypothetical protein